MKRNETADKKKKKLLSLSVSEDTYTAIKILAIIKDKNLSELVSDWVNDEYVKNKERVNELVRGMDGRGDPAN